jgi:predicted nucleotidyltransferase
MPTKEEILHFLKNHKQELAERFTVRRIGLFGSYLHGEAGDESDVDILVDLAQPTFDNYMDLKFFLEDYLTRPVDLVLTDSVKPRLKPIIAREVSYA